MKIASRQNPWFQRVRRAIREHGDEIAIEGPKAVADATTAGWEPIAVIRRGGEEDLAFAPELFDALSETKTSQGVLGLFRRPSFRPDAVFGRRDSIVVALDAVQDPGNVGTIIRLAAAFDAAGVVLLPGCADPFGPKAIRASVGSVLSVPLVFLSPAELLSRSLPLFAADGSGAPIAPPSREAVLVFGNEGAGVSAELRAAATPIAIATSGRVESLNVAASAAILLARSFEGRRPS